MSDRQATPRESGTIAFLSSGAKEAEEARSAWSALYGNVPPEEADVIVALGGDGLMLQTLHRTMKAPKPIYGMNRGSVGFLMNEYSEHGLRERLAAALPSIIHPLLMRAHDVQGIETTARAINEVSLLRQTYQAAKLRIEVDEATRLSELIADGVLVATPGRLDRLQPFGQRPDPAARRAADGADAALALPPAPLARRAAARRRAGRDRGSRGRQAPGRRGRRPFRNPPRHPGRGGDGPGDVAHPAARPGPFARRAHPARAVRLLGGVHGQVGARHRREGPLAEGRFDLTRTDIEVVEDDGATRTLSHEVYRHGKAAAVLLYDPGPLGR